MARAAHRLIRGAALALDGGYLLAWLMAPAAAWAPWALAAGLLLGGALVARRLRHAVTAGPPPAWALCLPLVLPVSGWVAGRPRPQPGGDGGQRVGLGMALAALVTLCVTGVAGERIVDPLLVPLDHHAEAYVDRALVEAGASYVGARAFERLLAIGGDISIGIGFIEGRPGQIFEPLRDLLDRFSTVVLVALGSLTLQKVMLELGSDLAVALFLPLALGLFALALCAGPPRRSARALASAGGLLLGTAVMLRLLLPLTGAGVAAVAQRALDERQAAAQATVERAADRVGLDVDMDRPPAAAAPEAGPSQPDEATLGARMGALQDRAEALQGVDQQWLDGLFAAFVDLVAVFLIETLIAPLIVLLLLWRLWLRLAGAWRPPPEPKPAT